MVEAEEEDIFLGFLSLEEQEEMERQHFLDRSECLDQVLVVEVEEQIRTLRQSMLEESQDMEVMEDRIALEDKMEDLDMASSSSPGNGGT